MMIRDQKGVVLGSRREAVQLMIREKYSPADILKLWSKLELEDWQESSILPTGWRRKGFIFLSPLMEKVRSISALLHILSTSPEYDQSDADRVRDWAKKESGTGLGTG